jgi:DNA-binding CsgD family transcriptional regulator
VTTFFDLTPRERDVARLVSRGLSCAQIASRLPNLRSRRGGTISRETVQNHVDRIAQRIGGEGRPRERIAAWMLEQKVA